jgi:hypothetical protein
MENAASWVGGRLDSFLHRILYRRRGYSYIDDDGNEEIYWFPEELILDGDTSAVEYVPES